MSNRRKPVRLSTKSLAALRTAYSTEYKKRVRQIENIEEYGFSILLHWNRVEATLKALYYFKHITEPFPAKLNFINRSWAILSHAYQNNNKNYILVLGDGSKSSGSLWHTRDLIVHGNHKLEKEDYERFKRAISWLIMQLQSNLPINCELAHKVFLQHKKKALASS